MHYDFHRGEERVTENYLPVESPATVLITSGASCPDAVVEAVINRLISFFPGAKSADDIIRVFE
jgi:4-hydroxy-3-methylbut-2-enyl diphosphate reductase